MSAPVQQSGGKGPRQRIWEHIRSLPDGTKFGVYDCQVDSDISYDAAVSYLRVLEKGGFLKRVRRAHNAQYAAWILIADPGIEAPRLDRHGRPVTTGRGIENMWQAVRHFLAEFDARELAAHAGTPSVPVSLDTARTWVATMHAAGYLIEIAPAVRGRKPARYRLDPTMNTGPFPPLIQRSRVVYDRNLGKQIWQEPPDWEAMP